MYIKTKILSILFLLFQISALVFPQDKEVSENNPVNDLKRDIISYYKALPKDTMRLRIIEKAREYIGVDYKWGESSANGFDCSGYVKYIYNQFGYELPHSSYAQYNASRRLIESKAKPGDLVFFVTRGERISHVGIYLGNKRFIHAPSTGNQVRIESLDAGFFRKTLAGFGTLF